MTSPQDLERRVSQNYNDIEDLYKITKKTHDEVKKIAVVQDQHGRRLSDIDETLIEHSVSLDKLTSSVDRVNGRLDRMEGTQNEHSVTLDSHGTKLDGHGEKLDEILGLLRQRE